MSLVVDAIEFAAHEHRGQRRKDAEATPYINHPIALVRILACEAGIEDPEVLAAAALHDFLEDCCGKKQERLEEGRATLVERFGERVLDYVNALTDDKTLPKDVRKRSQIEHAASAPHGAKLVKLADKIANLRDIAVRPPADWTLERRQDYYDWAAKVVDQVRGTHPLLEQLFDAELARRPSDETFPGMPHKWSTIEHAIALAAKAHEGQVDKAGAPYVLHPLRMMQSLSTNEERIVAILHDVVEDCEGWSPDRLRDEGFSQAVIEAVGAVTKRDGEPYDDFVLRAAANPIGRRVKLADLRDNCDLSRIAEPTERDFQRIEKYRRAIATIEGL